MKKDCAFQYYDGEKTVVNKNELTLNEAKQMWNDHYDGMVERVNGGAQIEVAIWINMRSKETYEETLVWLTAPRAMNNELYEPKYHTKFKI